MLSITLWEHSGRGESCAANLRGSMLFSSQLEGGFQTLRRMSQKRDADCLSFAAPGRENPGRKHYPCNKTILKSLFMNCLRDFLKNWHAPGITYFKIQPRKTNDTHHHLHGLPAHLRSPRAHWLTQPLICTTQPGVGNKSNKPSGFLKEARFFCPCPHQAAGSVPGGDPACPGAAIRCLSNGTGIVPKPCPFRQILVWEPWQNCPGIFVRHLSTSLLVTWEIPVTIGTTQA